jgi:hypothetical protein
MGRRVTERCHGESKEQSGRAWGDEVDVDVDVVKGEVARAWDGCVGRMGALVRACWMRWLNGVPMSVRLASRHLQLLTLEQRCATWALWPHKHCCNHHVRFASPQSLTHLLPLSLTPSVHPLPNRTSFSPLLSAKRRRPIFCKRAHALRHRRSSSRQRAQRNMPRRTQNASLPADTACQQAKAKIRR